MLKALGLKHLRTEYPSVPLETKMVDGLDNTILILLQLILGMLWVSAGIRFLQSDVFFVIQTTEKKRMTMQVDFPLTLLEHLQTDFLVVCTDVSRVGMTKSHNHRHRPGMSLCDDYVPVVSSVNRR